MATYGKFRPIKNGKHRKPKPRYVAFKTGEQGWNIPRPQWNPSTRQLKALALVFIVIAGVLGADQVAKVLFPNSPLNPLQNYDPFTLLWNGTSPAVTPSGSGPVVFNSKVNATCAVSCGGSPIDTVLSFPALTVSSGDTIIVEFWASHAIVSTFTITDTQSNSYTQRISAIPTTGLNVFIDSAPASSSGSDTITLTSSAQDAFAGVALDYGGSIGFGNTATNTGQGGVGPTTITSTITITVAATSSFILEFMAVSSSGGTGTVSASSSQIRRNQYSAPASSSTASGAFDKTGLSGSQSLTLSSTFTTDQNNWSHAALELKSVASVSSCAVGYNCILSGTDGTGNVKLTANSTTAAVTLTKAPIDVSTSSAKELFFYETWRNSTNLSVAQPWAWYLTTNSTLPTQKGYFPLNDTNVVLANIVYPNAGDTSKNYYEYMAKTGNSQSLLATSGQATNPYSSCPQSSTLYICSGAQTASGTQFLSISTTLNYTGNAGNTGNNGFSLLCTDGTPTQGPPTSNFCSSVSQLNTITPCTGAPICATSTLPFLNMQSGPYYLGFWSASGQSATILFGTAISGSASARANSVWYWVPNPTVATPSTVDTGGFFGPLVKALLGIGIWIFANIVSFITFLASVVAPFLAGTLSVLVAVLQAELNALGSFFGWGNIGDQFISFASGVITYFTVGLSDALLWLVRLISRGIDLIKIANFWVGFYLTGVLNVLADALNVIAFVVRIGTTITTFLGSSYVVIMVMFFLWYDADMGIAGWHAWFETVKWITFISFDFLERMINFGISSVTWIIGRIPTFDGTTLPELPTIAIGGGPIWPSTEMTSLREGNVFALFGQMIGVVFLVWFESSGLPGSIGANVPNSVAGSMAPFVTPLLIFVAIMGLVFVISIPANLVRGTFGLNDLPSTVVGRARAGVISSGQGVSGRLVKKHPERKFNIQVNRGLGVRGLRPHLRKPKNIISGPSTQGVG